MAEEEFKTQILSLKKRLSETQDPQEQSEIASSIQRIQGIQKKQESSLYANSASNMATPSRAIVNEPEQEEEEDEERTEGEEDAPDEPVNIAQSAAEQSKMAVGANFVCSA